jgi:Peptidase A4 family
MKAWRRVSWILWPICAVALTMVPGALAASAEPPGNKLWNGYVIRSSSTSQVAGWWQVPNLNCATGENNSNASQWIGLDGINAGLVQTGVASKCVVGVQVNAAFFQVLPRMSAAQYPNPPTHVVWAGDRVEAEIRNVGGNRYSISLRDNGFSWDFSTIEAYDGAPKTAEWIVEAGPRSGNQENLSDFGTVHFEAAFFNDNVVTSQDAIKFVAENGSGNAKTEVSDISQFGGQGPNFDIKWTRP